MKQLLVFLFTLMSVIGFSQRTTITKNFVGGSLFQVETVKVFSDSSSVVTTSIEMSSADADAYLLIEEDIKTREIKTLTDKIDVLTAHLAKLTAELALLDN